MRNRCHLFPISLVVAFQFSKGWCHWKAYTLLHGVKLDMVPFAVTCHKYQLKADQYAGFLLNRHFKHVVVVFLATGVVAGELPECTQDLMIDLTRGYYQHFVPVAEVK